MHGLFTLCLNFIWDKNDKVNKLINSKRQKKLSVMVKWLEALQLQLGFLLVEKNV